MGQQVLSRGDVSNVWSDEVCREVANDVMEELGGADGGFITFDTWLHYMRERALRHQAKSPRRVTRAESDMLHAISQPKIIMSYERERLMTGIPSKGSEERRQDSKQKVEHSSESDGALTPQ